MTTIRKEMMKKNLNSKRICAVSAAKKKDTPLWTVREIRTCERDSLQTTSTKEFRRSRISGNCLEIPWSKRHTC